MKKGENDKQISARTEMKERIVRTALEDFQRLGIRAVRMDDLATRMGISKRTLYEMFKDKEELLVDCILLSQQQIQARVKEIYYQSKNVLEVILGVFLFSIERFHATSKLFYDEIKKYPSAYNMVCARRDSDSEDKLAFFRQGVEQGFFRSDVNFAIVNELVRQQFDLLIGSKFFSQYPFVEVYESIMFTYLRGISTERGAQELETFIKEYRNGKN